MDANKPYIPDLSELKRKLLDASSEHDDGHRYVRASVAAKVIGIGPSLGVHWVKRGLVRALKFRIPSRRGSVRGEVVAWRVDDAIEQARAYWSGRCRHWTRQEDDRLLDRLGRIPIERLAIELGRTVKAVRGRAGELGLNQLNAQGEYTTGEVARLCGVPLNRVVAWCDRRHSPLKHRRLHDGRRTRLIQEVSLRHFLSSNPQILAGLSVVARQRVERATMTSAERRKVVAA
ncbi:MAG: hypothetical protein AAF711_00515 [Planctomycetota bacterium]